MKGTPMGNGKTRGRRDRDRTGQSGRRGEQPWRKGCEVWRRTGTLLWVQEPFTEWNTAGKPLVVPEKQTTKYAEAISSLKEDKQ